MRHVSLNSLEYVLLEFSEESLTRLDLPVTTLPASRSVHFLPPDDTTKWPKTMGCNDLAVTDFDLDGRQDLIVLQEYQLIAWGRKGDDQPWTLIASEETGGAFTGLLAYDFDDDADLNLKSTAGPGQPVDALKHESYLRGLSHTADPDAILFGPAGLKLLENSQATNSESRSLVPKSGGSAFDEVRDVIAAAVADIDSDGDLDLIVVTVNGLRIFSNRGNLTFSEVTAQSLLPASSIGVTAMAIVDWDRDSDVDLLIATANGGGLLENVRHGRLQYRSLDNFPMLQGSTSLDIGDFDGDGSWDVVAAGPQGANVVLTNRTPAGLVKVRQSISLAAKAVRFARAGDFDNDGGLDVLVFER